MDARTEMMKHRLLVEKLQRDEAVERHDVACNTERAEEALLSAQDIPEQVVPIDDASQAMPGAIPQELLTQLQAIYSVACECICRRIKMRR